MIVGKLKFHKKNNNFKIQTNCAFIQTMKNLYDITREIGRCFNSQVFVYIQCGIFLMLFLLTTCRIYFFYHSMKGENVGWNRKTFAAWLMQYYWLCNLILFGTCYLMSGVLVIWCLEWNKSCICAIWCFEYVFVIIGLSIFNLTLKLGSNSWVIKSDFKFSV